MRRLDSRHAASDGARNASGASALRDRHRGRAWRRACGGTAAVALAVATLGVTASSGGAAAPGTGDRAGITLWNRLDSADATRHSVVGPDGTVLGGSFVRGRFGGAYQAMHDEDYRVRFPRGAVNRARGTIEFWGRIVGFSSRIEGEGGNQPGFFTIIDDQGNGYGQVFFTGNDGAGGGGLSAFAGHNETATGAFGDWEYSQVLGRETRGWHHYALAWDERGIRDVGGRLRRLAVYVDGALASTYWDTYYAGSFPEFTPTTMLRLGTIDRIEQGAVQVDNLVVWNCAITKFPTRASERPTDRRCA